MLLRIETKYFCAGALFEKKDGKWECVQAAPIIKWMVGKPIAVIENYAKRHTYQWIKTT